MVVILKLCCPPVAELDILCVLPNNGSNAKYKTVSEVMFSSILIEVFRGVQSLKAKFRDGTLN
jgi:hypothetical protein